jgi:hypothetical protein
MKPITLAQMSQDGPNAVYVAFKYPNPVSGFEHALILVVEQDVAQDAWKVVWRSTTAANGCKFQYLDFENASYPGTPESHGPEDDIGTNRKHLIPVVQGDNWTSYRQLFDAKQPDADPKLQFYAVIAIVAVAGGRPVAQLGDLVVTQAWTMT